MHFKFNANFHASMNSIYETKICNIFLIYGPNIYYGCLLELPHLGGSNKHPQSMFKGVLTAWTC